MYRKLINGYEMELTTIALMQYNIGYFIKPFISDDGKHHDLYYIVAYPAEPDDVNYLELYNFKLTNMKG